MIKARFSGSSLTVRTSSTRVAPTLLIDLEDIIMRPHDARGALHLGPQRWLCRCGTPVLDRPTISKCCII